MMIILVFMVVYCVLLYHLYSITHHICTCAKGVTGTLLWDFIRQDKAYVKSKICPSPYWYWVNISVNLDKTMVSPASLPCCSTSTFSMAVEMFYRPSKIQTHVWILTLYLLSCYWSSKTHFLARVWKSSKRMQTNSIIIIVLCKSLINT